MIDKDISNKKSYITSFMKFKHPLEIAKDLNKKTNELCSTFKEYIKTDTSKENRIHLTELMLEAIKNIAIAEPNGMQKTQGENIQKIAKTISSETPDFYIPPKYKIAFERIINVMHENKINNKEVISELEKIINAPIIKPNPYKPKF